MVPEDPIDECIGSYKLPLLGHPDHRTPELVSGETASEGIPPSHHEYLKALKETAPHTPGLQHGLQAKRGWVFLTDAIASGCTGGDKPAEAKRQVESTCGVQYPTEMWVNNVAQFPPDNCAETYRFVKTTTWADQVNMIAYRHLAAEEDWRPARACHTCVAVLAAEQKYLNQIWLLEVKKANKDSKRRMIAAADDRS